MENCFELSFYKCTQGGWKLYHRTSSLNQTIIRTDKEAKLLAELFNVYRYGLGPLARLFK